MKWNSSVALLVSLALGLGLTALSCKGKSNPVNPGPPANVTIDIVADMGTTAFGALPETVLVGQRVSWHNTRGTTHTATSTGGPAGGQWNTGNIGGGSTSTSIQMNTAGTYPYHCTIHTTMTSTLVVKP
jgi:plastocyanin